MGGQSALVGPLNYDERWQMLKRVWIALVPFLLFLAACGGDGDNGDTLLTGLSGLVIVVLVIVGIWYFARRRG